MVDVSNIGRHLRRPLCGLLNVAEDSLHRRVLLLNRRND